MVQDGVTLNPNSQLLVNQAPSNELPVQIITLIKMNHVHRMKYDDRYQQHLIFD